jgi:dienelactone hydrolase
MPAPNLKERDPLDDFERRDVTLLGQSRLVFVAGSGAAVIVMTEMPGISPEVARFARFVRDAGFTVWMPNLFGDPDAPTIGCGALSARAPVSRSSAPSRPTRRSGHAVVARAARTWPLCGAAWRDRCSHQMPDDAGAG